MSKEVLKNTKFNRINTKVNILKNKIPHAATLIHINQYNTDQQKLKKEIRDVD